MRDDIVPAENGLIAEFEEVKQDVAAGREPSRSVREILRWFGARRRRTGVVERIDAELELAHITTHPDYTTAWIDAAVTFKRREVVATPSVNTIPSVDSSVGDADVAMATDDLPDMTHLVRMLDAANRAVITVNPQDPIEKAITLMLAYDYSQLAVMTGVRDLKGVISWKSIGSRLSQKNKLSQVSDAMEDAPEVSDTDSLFETTKVIIQRDYVFVRSSIDRKITGIVTATDLSEQFRGLSEPFLLLGRIENQIRRIIHGVFDLVTLRDAVDDKDPTRKSKITKASQLTFGEYLRIFEQEANWAKIGFVADRKTFVAELGEVRQIRNEIMHFHLDVVDAEDTEQLRRFSRLLDQLEKLSS